MFWTCVVSFTPEYENEVNHHLVNHHEGMGQLSSCCKPDTAFCGDLEHIVSRNNIRTNIQLLECFHISLCASYFTLGSYRRQVAEAMVCLAAVSKTSAVFLSNNDARPLM